MSRHTKQQKRRKRKERQARLAREGVEHAQRLMDIVARADAIADVQGDEFGKRIVQGMLDVVRGKRKARTVCRELGLTVQEFGVFDLLIEKSVLYFRNGEVDTWEIGQVCDEVARLHRQYLETRPGIWTRAIRWLTTRLICSPRPEETWWFEFVEGPLAALLLMAMEHGDWKPEGA